MRFFAMRAPSLRSEYRPRYENSHRHRGVVLIMVLLVIVLISLAAFTFSEMMVTERSATILHGDRLQTRRVLRALEAMGELFPTLSQLRRRVLAQGAVLQNLSPATLSRSVVEHLQRNTMELSELSSRCRDGLRSVPYPFEHASGKISIADYAGARFEGYGAVMASYKTAEALLERLFDVYFRLLGHLCATAAETENKMGGG